MRNRWHRLQKRHPNGVRNDEEQDAAPSLAIERSRSGGDALTALGAPLLPAPAASGYEERPSVIVGSDHGRTRWSEAEDRTIEDGVRALGCRWRQISATLPGRSDSSIRNRWHRLLRGGDRDEASSARTSATSPLQQTQATATPLSSPLEGALDMVLSTPPASSTGTSAGHRACAPSISLAGSALEAALDSARPPPQAPHELAQEEPPHGAPLPPPPPVVDSGIPPLATGGCGLPRAGLLPSLLDARSTAASAASSALSPASSTSASPPPSTPTQVASPALAPTEGTGGQPDRQLAMALVAFASQRLASAEEANQASDSVCVQ